MGFCSDPLSAYPVYTVYDDLEIGLVKVVIALLYFCMSFVTIGWVKSNERKAREEFSPKAVNSVIFPPYVRILWVSAFSNAYIGFLFLFVPVRITAQDKDASEYLYPIAWAIQHFVIEGIAFMFMQKGCGIGATRTSMKYATVWALITYFLMQLWYSTTHVVSITFYMIWSGIMLVFFGCVWLLPQERLYRRPVAVWYSKFWFLFRIVPTITYCFSQSRIDVLENIGNCGYTFGPLLLFPLIQPYICYRALLEDSLWWKGGFLDVLDSPLSGLDFDNHTAQTLGTVLDHINYTQAARLVNFAHVQTSWSLLGQGSFSKVYRGTYKRVPCAIKVIFSADLTAEDINKAAVEATILSAVKSPNIVDIYGICVNPPNVCILLEICTLGSLSDVLRNGKMTLGITDKMYLALGCCSGLNALHSFSSDIVHRDIKSMNFLVDSELNAKLADLELGQNEALSDKTKADDATQEFLLNWMPPEFISNEVYTKASDVYALALVLWEIISHQIPFGEMDSISIRNTVLAGRRLEFPACIPAYRALIEKGWSMDPTERPSAGEMKEAVEIIWRESFYSNIEIHLKSSAFCDSLSRLLDSSDGKKYAASLNNCKLTNEMIMHKNSSSDVLADEISLSPLNSLRESLSPEMKNISDQFRHLYLLFLSEGNWSSILNDREDYVVIISKSAPHLILHCSPLVESLLGLSAPDAFAHNFDKFVTLSEGEEARHTLTTLSRRSSFFFFTPVQNALSKFYVQMKSKGRAHAVVDVLHTFEGATRCSINSFPIYKSSIDNPDEQKGASGEGTDDTENVLYYGLLLVPLAMSEVMLH